MNSLAFIQEYLAGGGKPRVLSTAMLRRMLDAAFGSMHQRSQARKIKDLLDGKVLACVMKGTYVNLVATPPVEAAEAVPLLRPDAVVSLHTVLGEFGVLNNHTDHVTAILPLPGGEWRVANPRVGSLRTPVGTFDLYSMPHEILSAGAYEDRLLVQRLYPCATPERAFLDHLYLGASARSKLTPPPLDCDIGDLDQTRLWRLAAAMGVEHTLESWLAQKAAYDDDEDVQNNMSMRLGF